jgi:signal transduction histidine kinase
MPFERHHSALIVASAVTVASFIGVTAYSQNRLARLDALSTTIEVNALPSVEYLSSAALRLTRLRRLLDDPPSMRNPATRAAVGAEVSALDDDLNAYLRITPLPGEGDYWTKLRTDTERAKSMVLAAAAQEQPGSPGTPPDPDEVDDAITQAVQSVLAAFQYDIRQSVEMARDVRNVRPTTTSAIVALDGLATLVAALAAVVAYRASRRHDQLENEHSVLLASRVEELDRFAGRVAHDVLSPLGAIGAGLSLLARTSDARGQGYIDRSQRALQRVRQLVDDLLAFARSGAHPDTSLTCTLDTALPGILSDFADAAARRGIDLVVESEERLQVRCSLGVLTSVVQNLVRNAINYMGTRPVKRIVVRARRSGAAARVEVEDTGPGIPSELLSKIFEPFTRGPNEKISGTGLGLATVKRLVDGHGGTIRVDSRPDEGSCFRVELPLASHAEA